MKPFKIKESHLVPYNYNLNKVLANKDNMKQKLRGKIEYSEEYRGNFTTRRLYKQLSNL